MIYDDVECRDSVPVDELESRARSAGEQADWYRDEARAQETRIAGVMESLAYGWQGGHVYEVMRKIDTANDAVVRRYRGAAVVLDDERESLQLLLTRREREDGRIYGEAQVDAGRGDSAGVSEWV